MSVVLLILIGEKIFFKHIAHGGKRGECTDGNNKGGKGAKQHKHDE